MNMPTTIRLPLSKSIANRVMLIRVLTGERLFPVDVDECEDIRVMARALVSSSETLVNAGASGTALRFLAAYFSMQEGRTVSLLSEHGQGMRPIQGLLDVLRRMGADIADVGSLRGHQILINGKKLRGGEISLPAEISSQYASALLLIAPYVSGEELRIKMEGAIASRPYIDMTLQVMRDFGGEASWEDERTLCVKHTPYVNLPHYLIEPDWSAAAYWYEFMALSSDARTLFLSGLRADSYQGDSRVARYFDMLGVQTTYTPEGVYLTRKVRTAERLEMNLSDTPDLVQSLVVTCALLGIPFVFSGLHHLQYKETNRLVALIAEMASLGYTLGHDGAETLSWDGAVRPVQSFRIHTYGDHRMAMAFAPAYLCFPNLTIANPEVVSKSYPRFWEDMKGVYGGLPFE
ncbi:MAG: 3-phosphoshikimate 1-carboxyvinyltransferase [Prevotellaceae bacterium]|jgi:3-phosphoshikimate 1-carboxyvinyltransferase|nr:3-phosphoshikimate 1-carboxyvinyltransferase [Prevotellaceae bacterium]